MTENQNFKKEVEENKKKIKLVLLIYDHIRMKNHNIDTFKTSSIIYSKKMKGKDIVTAFNEYKSKVYNRSSNINNKTHYFLELMKAIYQRFYTKSFRFSIDFSI